VAKKIALFFLPLLFCLFLTGCWGKRETDETANVLALALDKGEKDKIKITLQIANPQAAAGGGGDGAPSGGPGEKPFIVVSIEAPSVIGGLNLLNSTASRELSLMHNKVVIYSSELARAGIEEYLAPLVRYRELRRTNFVFVSRGKAGEFLQENIPSLESIPSKFFEQMYRSVSFTGFIPRVQLHHFYENVKSKASQPIATLVDINHEVKQEKEKKGKEEGKSSAVSGGPEAENKNPDGGVTEDRPHEGHYLAGEIPRGGVNPAELMGTAVFRGDRMVGEIDGEETRLMLMLRGEFSRGFLTIPDPAAKDRIIVLDLRQPVSPQVKVELADERPRVTVTVALEAEFLSIQSGINYERPELKKEIESEISEYVSEHAGKLIEKSQREFKSDIFGFGQFARHLVPTWAEWENLNWPELYPEAEVDLQVHTRIRRTGLLVKMTPVGGGL